MTITDEVLSAFLDNELTAVEMESVRAAIAHNQALAERLSRIASADALIRKQAAIIDSEPMPQRVLSLLEEPARLEESARGNNVVSLSTWRRLQRQARTLMSEYAMLAASVALVAGFISGQALNRNTPDSSAGNALVAALNQTPSGQMTELADGRAFISQFSFRDQQARICRQYVITGTDHVSNHIACRDNAEWQVMASINDYATDARTYQPATRNALLDTLLDEMMPGQPLSLYQERAALGN